MMRNKLHEISTSDPISSHVNAIHTPSPNVLISILILFPSSSESFLALRFTINIPYAFLISRIRATCPIHLILLDLFNNIGVGCKLWSCSLCNFLQPPLTSYHSGSTLFLSKLCSKPVICALFSSSERPGFTPHKK
jgi:hypothetical protein